MWPADTFKVLKISTRSNLYRLLAQNADMANDVLMPLNKSNLKSSFSKSLSVFMGEKKLVMQLFMGQVWLSSPYEYI